MVAGGDWRFFPEGDRTLATVGDWGLIGAGDCAVGGWGSGCSTANQTRFDSGIGVVVLVLVLVLEGLGVWLRGRLAGLRGVGLSAERDESR